MNWPWRRYRPAAVLARAAGGEPIEPIVESRTEAGTELATRLRAAMEQADPAELRLYDGPLDEDVDDLHRRLAEVTAQRDQLAAVLDERRPAPDPDVLGPILQRAYFGPQRTVGTESAYEMWVRAAETAIDYVRGLWPPPAQASAELWPYNLAPGELDLVIGPDGFREHRLAATMRIVSAHRGIEGTGFGGVTTVPECSCGWKEDGSGAGGQHSWHVAHELDRTGLLLRSGPRATGEIAASLLAPGEIAALDAEADLRLADRDELAQVLHGYHTLHGDSVPWSELHDLGRAYYRGLASHVQAHYWRGACGAETTDLLGTRRCIEPAGHPGRHRSERVTPWAAPQTSPGGGERVEAPDSPAPAPGDPADTAAFGDDLGVAWCAVQGPRCCHAAADDKWLCTRMPHERGQHVATTERGKVMAVWPHETAPETSPGGGEGAEVAPASTGAIATRRPDDTVELPMTVACEDEVGVRPAHDQALAAVTDELIEDLAKALAQRELDLAGGRWETMHHSLRDHYRARVHDVIDAGWRPPAQDPATLVPAVAAVLAAHEIDRYVSSDRAWNGSTCQCGDWDGRIHHAEHVAEVLLLGARAVVA